MLGVAEREETEVNVEGPRKLSWDLTTLSLNESEKVSYVCKCYGIGIPTVKMEEKRS